MVKRKKFTTEYKARIVLEIMTEGKSISAVSREYGIKDSVLSRWKQEFIELFENGASKDGQDERMQNLRAWLDDWRQNWKCEKKLRTSWIHGNRKVDFS